MGAQVKNITHKKYSNVEKETKKKHSVNVTNPIRKTDVGSLSLIKGLTLKVIVSN